MTAWNIVGEELRNAEDLLQKGCPEEILDRLPPLLEEIKVSDPASLYAKTGVLWYLSAASQALGQAQQAQMYQSRAVCLFRKEQTPPPEEAEQVWLFLNLARTLNEQGLQREAMFFADLALECITQHLEFMMPEDTAEVLRQYGLLAAASGLIPAAQFALTLGLVLLENLNGLETEIAEDAVALGLNADFGVVSKVGRMLHGLLRSQ